MPTFGSALSGLGKAPAPSSPLHTTPLSLSANNSLLPDTFSQELWSSKSRLEGHSELNTSVARARAVSEEELNRSMSPSPYALDSSFDHDSEEDCETAAPHGIRVGSNFQADLDGLYGAELADDNATLLWDPDTMTEDDLDLLFAQCKVADSTFKQVTASSASHAAAPASPSGLSSSLESETISTTSSNSLSASNTPRSSFLPIGQFLDVVHEAGCDATKTVAQLKQRGFFGWSPLQSAFAVWTPEEMESFETAMASFPKDFDRIAALVKTRTAGECTVYYYSWKHSERCRAWRGQITASNLEAKFEEEQIMHHSRMLPTSQPHVSQSNRHSTSRKRKRETDVPLDSSERLYLEALGALQDQTEHPDHLMLNLILNAPNTFVEDLPQAYLDDEIFTAVDSLSAESVAPIHAPNSLSSSQVATTLPLGHGDALNMSTLTSQPTVSSSLTSSSVLSGSAFSHTSNLNASLCNPQEMSQYNQGESTETSAPGLQTTSNLNFSNSTDTITADGCNTTNTNTSGTNIAKSNSFARGFQSSASPKRPKMAEPDDHTLIHAVDMRASSGAPTTVDPSIIFSSLCTPPEPTTDFFLQF